MSVVPAAPPVAPAGRIEGGAYVDAGVPLRVAIPPGWTAHPGRSDEPVRVTFREPRSPGLLVSVSAVAGGDLTPLPHPACEWTFRDVGRFPLQGRDGPVGIATCTPTDASTARVLDWAFVEAGYAWHVEVHSPVGRLGDAPAAADLVMAGTSVGGP